MRLFSICSTLLFFVISLNSSYAQVVSGKVLNSSNKSGVPYASVVIVNKSTKSKKVGVASDEQGNFLLAIKALPLVLEFSATGFITKRLVIGIDQKRENLIIELDETVKQLSDFVVTTEKISQEELKAPIETIKVDLKAIQSTPSFSFFDAIGNLKGVDLTTQSVIINSVNTRGFNSSTNQRFRQFTDGIDNQAPGLSFSLGNIVGGSSLDIESIEVVPGPASVFYGPSSFNGILELKTKNPFDFPGLSFTAKAATVTVEKDRSKFFNIGNSFISDLSLRYATSFKDRIGLKINTALLNGVDFKAKNYRNVGAGRSFHDEYNGENQGIDLVNVYGDDRSLLVSGPGLLQDTAFTVTRAGYREEDLVNYNASNVKLNAELQLKITPDIILGFTTFYGITDAMITNEDRIALRDFEIFQQKVQLEGKNFLLRAYRTEQDAGNTFNVGVLSEEILQRTKPNVVWFDQYRRSFENGNGVVIPRRIANSTFPGQYLKFLDPESDDFDSLRNIIVNKPITENGSRLFDKSGLQHIEGSYSFDKIQNLFEKLQIGGNYRLYDPNTNGTIFTDSIGNDLTNFEYGTFVEVSKSITSNLDISGSLRYDENENFKGKFSQRLSVVKQQNDNQFFRASFQRGFRFPNIREQFFNQDLGEKLIIGGLSQVTDRYDLQGNSFLEQSLEDYQNAVINDIVVENRQIEFAKIRNSNIMAEGIISQDLFRGLKPEQITSFEIGYKNLIQGRRIVEVNYYRNYYQNFIGNLRVIKPRTSPAVDLQRSIEQAINPSSSDLIYVTANSEKQIVTQGLEILYDITGLSGINFTVNATFADISQDSDDPLVPGFNTAPFKWNVKVGHRRINENFGAELTWRARTNFEWQSPFADGFVRGFSTFDCQMTFKLPKVNSQLRVGANNVYNIRQFNTFGGPEISAFYYVSFTYDPFQSN
ncbi:hypothetical protein BFP97_03570 [Roseivirga sp. 4D4]|uniref:TonB-dependent receptor n=1 Tax=Roseivirga sp. 4D4 TaxID=1889784 RepID=UPI000853C60E|nr:TonB-dependent receptor [Roseivirga sp. 4D4]OEK00639.1 hypothetical protein BFP97_03570 [Roseivirga sp. 4D4]